VGGIGRAQDHDIGCSLDLAIRIARRLREVGDDSVAVAGGIEHYTVTELIRREPRPGGRILTSQRLFEGIFLETVDMLAPRL